MKKGLEEQNTLKVLELTHCTPPENYFITSYDMVDKSIAWAHIGSWDFERSLIYNTLKKKGGGNENLFFTIFYNNSFGRTTWYWGVNKL